MRGRRWIAQVHLRLSASIYARSVLDYSSYHSMLRKYGLDKAILAVEVPPLPFWLCGQ